MIRRGPYTLVHDLPIFNIYTLEELSEASGYSH